MYSDNVTNAMPLHGVACNHYVRRGLDNAGKSTVLRKFNGEDISTISPTLGFDIKTLEYKS